MEIKNVSVRYRANLPLVLNNISFNIKNTEKVGIVGRTGSGKSTFLLTLTRILELAENENRKNGDPKLGKIMIDGVDISTIGLHHLRNHITAIPQDPWLV
jgi:ABC-type multidrug transport system fused ATPase/permease subunit